METETMGRVMAEATIENLRDLWDIDRGLCKREDARSITVDDALVDTGATTLALPTRFIQQLGLNKVYERSATSGRGVGLVDVYEALRLTLLGDRFCTVDVIEGPDDMPPVIIGTALLMLDLVVDENERRIAANPAHGGEQMLELY